MQRRIVADQQSPWLTFGDGSAQQRAKKGRRYLTKEVKNGRLKAAVVGGRRELYFKPEWIDQWLEAQATPIVMNVRRRA